VTAPEQARVAVVTGAARPWGVGRAAAAELGRLGYDLVIVDLREDWGKDAEDELTEFTGRRVIFVPTDVSSRTDVSAMADTVRTEFGRADVLVNNAAVHMLVATTDFTDEQFDQVMHVNVLGPMLCAQYLVPMMQEQHYGRIVNISSSSLYVPDRLGAPGGLYKASKGALAGWTKSAAIELAPDGIVVSSVIVGGVSTAMGRDTAPTNDDDEHQRTVTHKGLLPWGDLLPVADVGAVIAQVADAPHHAYLGASVNASGGRALPL
jgi:NAD(P)-dependent dehydrogenase (short-subunit alcohol dehydrogenase family)